MTFKKAMFPLMVEIALTNSHGLTWFIDTQAQPTTNNGSNSIAYCSFHIKILRKDSGNMFGSAQVNAAVQDNFVNIS